MSSSSTSRQQQQMAGALVRGDAAQGSSSSLAIIRQQQPLRIKKATASLVSRLSLKSILHKNNTAASDVQKSAKGGGGGGGLRLVPGRLGKNHSSKRRSSAAASLRSSNMTESTKNNTAENNEPNVLQWLEQTCPPDVLPSILAYCGPKTTFTLSRTNRHWNQIVKQESTWRTMCIDLYKWKEGEPEPASWFAHYQQHPCVPIDYSTLNQALKLAAPTNNRSNNLKQVRSLKILLRPGRYQLERSIQVQAPAGVELSIETMQLPPNLYQKPRPSTSSLVVGQELMEQARPAQSQQQQQVRRPYRRSSSSSSFLALIRCARPGATSAEESTERSESEGAGVAADVADIFGSAAEDSQPPTHATLILRTRRHNEPAVCVRQGQLSLRNVEISHQSHGLDIWNGNAAIQVQPPEPLNDNADNDNAATPPVVRTEPLPSATLVGCKVSSKSGRGIVNIDGGSVTIEKCAVHDCAATGVYIGGPGSRARISDTDVLRNGVGNRSSRRGIARGHSGVYLEQGLARITNCNIAENTLTGISAVSPDNAILHLHDSSLVSNGTFQLELPSTGTNARDQSVLDNNQMASQGAGRVRSGLLPQDVVSTTTNEGETPATMRR